MINLWEHFRTVKPCGMDKGNVKTTLVNGQDVQVTWHLGYPHRGGFKLQLLDSRDNHLLDLTPQDLFEGVDNEEVSFIEGFEIQMSENFNFLATKLSFDLEPRFDLPRLHHSIGEASFGVGSQI